MVKSSVCSHDMGITWSRRGQVNVLKKKSRIAKKTSFHSYLRKYTNTFNFVTHWYHGCIGIGIGIGILF